MSSFDPRELDELAARLAPVSAYEGDPDLTPGRGPGGRPGGAPLLLIPGKPRARPVLQFFDEVEPVLASNYLIKGVLDVGAMSVIYGPSNSGKTFFAMDVAYHLAMGQRWRDRRVMRTAVLYLAAEGGAGATNRLAALREAHGATNVPLGLRRGGLDLLRAADDLQEVNDLVADMRARFPGLPFLIVVDTLSRVMAGGDENAAADMTALIRNIDALRAATGAHIMIVHHSGKDVAKGARGHSSLRAATDTEIEIRHENGYRSAHIVKQRDNEGGEVYSFTLRSAPLGLDQDGDEVRSCVVEPDDAPPPLQKRKLGPQQKLFLDTLSQLTAEPGGWVLNPGGVGFPEPGRVRCVPLEALREAFKGKTAAANPRDAFLSAFEGLQGPRGLVCMNGGLVWRVGVSKADSEGE